MDKRFSSMASNAKKESSIARKTRAGTNTREAVRKRCENSSLSRVCQMKGGR